VLAPVRSYCFINKQMPMLTDCSPKDRCTSLLDSEEQDITPVQFGLCQDDSEEEQMAQPTSYKRGGYVPRSARVLRSQVTPPPCIRNPYNTDPRIDDNLFCVRQRKSSGTHLCAIVIQTCSFQIPANYMHLFVRSLCFKADCT
jgi:hypothetical protein